MNYLSQPNAGFITKNSQLFSGRVTLKHPILSQTAQQNNFPFPGRYFIQSLEQECTNPET